MDIIAYLVRKDGTNNEVCDIWDYCRSKLEDYKIPKQVWYCGDQYTCDIEGAIQAGIQPIWYHTIDKNMSIGDNIICLEHWNELQKLLEMKEDI